MSNFGWTIGFQRSEMVGVQFISIEIPVIRKTLKPNRTEILTKRYEKMFRFPKLAKSAGDLKLCNSLQEEFGPRRSWFLLVQCPGLWLCHILCIFFLLPSFSQASFHLFFSVASLLDSLQFVYIFLYSAVPKTGHLFQLRPHRCQVE